MFNKYDDVRLIGLVGKAGSGKDTLADAIAVDGWEKVAFADSLKRMCIDYLGLSHDDAYTQEGKMKFNETWGMTNRAILQKVGTDAMRNGFDKDVWVKILGIRIRKMLDEGRKVVVTDCRFDNECQMIEDMGGLVVEVVRDASSNLSGEEQKHASEQPVSRKYVAFTVDNNIHISKIRDTFNNGMSVFNGRCSSTLDVLRTGVSNGILSDVFASKALLESRKFVSIVPDIAMVSSGVLHYEWRCRDGVCLMDMRENGIIFSGCSGDGSSEFCFGDVEGWGKAMDSVSDGRK